MLTTTTGGDVFGAWRVDSGALRPWVLDIARAVVEGEYAISREHFDAAEVAAILWTAERLRAGWQTPS